MSDCGTENVFVAAAQRFLRREDDDDWAAEKSFMYGRSTSNQRIESWWGMLRKGCTDWWITFFKDMRDSGLYCDDDCIQVECLKFCFMNILRNELHRAARLWNLHRIRPSSNVESPSGRPDVLYFLPEVNDTRDYKVTVDLDELQLVEDRCCYRPTDNGCTDEFTQLATVIMNEQNMEIPATSEEATTLYITLLEEIQKLH